MSTSFVIRQTKLRLGLRCLLVSTVVLMVSSTQAQAQPHTDTASFEDFVNSVASVTFNAGWPTAYYEGSGVVSYRPVTNGIDVLVKFWGRSRFTGGPLWFDFAFRLRGADLVDVRPERYTPSAVVPPFTTVGAFGSFMQGFVAGYTQQ